MIFIRRCTIFEEVIQMKTAVIYWSVTGNTEQMAAAVAEGAGADLFAVSAWNGTLEDYDRLAFGCPAMGAEVLEEEEFEPFFSAIEDQLSGKTVALFGSYGWGDGEWMRNWEERVKAAGAVLVQDEGLIVNETPSEDDLATCKALGAQLVA
jgi:flavodoxin short chain